MIWLLSAALAADTALGRLDRGDPFPDLTVVHEGQEHRVHEFDGVRVVEFWATWCGPCIVSIPYLKGFASRHPGEVSLLSVCTDFAEEERQAKRMSGQKPDNYWLVAPTPATTQAFADTGDGIWMSVPQTFVVTEDGRLYQHLVGGGPRIGKKLERALRRQARWVARNPVR